VGTAVGAPEVMAEQGPEVFHGDHEEGRIDEILELVQQAATEHGGKAAGEVLAVVVR